MKTLFSTLDKQSSKYVWRLSLLITLVLSAISATLDKGIYLDFFYVFPITLASWYGSVRSGLALAIVSSILLAIIKAIQDEFGTGSILIYWFACATSFSILAILITNFRNVHRVEVTAAGTDHLTKICNSRGFYIELANELLRSSRYDHTFSLAYIDIDDFKSVNDSLGHAEGDRLLVEVANCLTTSLRETDTVARLGGDEFACLLPETKQDEAKAAFLNTSQMLRERMSLYNWSISFSVGLVTFETMPADIKEALKVADELMYSVKKAEKNNISYKVWHGNF